MIRSTERLLQNRVEALQLRRDELLSKLAVLESQLATERNRYEVELKLRRREALLGARPQPDGRELSRLRRLRREVFGQGYMVGLGISLLLGLLAVAAR
jgi:hypothetical protein